MATPAGGSARRSKANRRAAKQQDGASDNEGQRERKDGDGRDENFEAKIMHIPGHTTGHICFYFYKNNIIFTGDTLFSLGCGKIFEGTYQEMFESLNKIKSLPADTKIYCGHEYTLQNSKFCIKHDPENTNLQNKILEIAKKLEKAQPTIPSTLKDEIECNIFLRAKNVESFSKLRDLKDNF